MAQGCNRSRPFDDPNVAWVGMSVYREMIDYQNDEVADRDQSNDARVLERIQTSQEAQGDNQEHESSNPEVPVKQVRRVPVVANKAQDHSRHQVSDNDHVRNAHAKAFNGNCGIKNYRCVRVCYLRQGEE